MFIFFNKKKRKEKKGTNNNVRIVINTVDWWVLHKDVEYCVSLHWQQDIAYKELAGDYIIALAFGPQIKTESEG